MEAETLEVVLWEISYRKWVMNEKPLPSAFRIFSPLGERRWIQKNGGEMIPNSVDGIFECSITKYCVLYLQEVGWGLFIQPAKKFGTKFRHGNIFCLLPESALFGMDRRRRRSGKLDNFQSAVFAEKKVVEKFVLFSADWKRGSLHIFLKKETPSQWYIL